MEEFRAGLRDLGYVEGKNVIVEYRFAEGDNARLLALAQELAEQRVDVIVTHARGVTAARRATASIPIVMLVFADAQAAGLVDNLARPGGNVTGSTAFTAELMAKRLELLKALLPKASEVAYLLNPDYPLNGPILETMMRTASPLGMALQQFEAREPGDFAPLFASMAERNLGGLVLHDDPLFVSNSGLAASLAAKHRLAGIGALEFARAGGLMAYGVEFRDLYRRAAYFVDRILKGARPGDLPVERVTTFRQVVNLKVARDLSLTVPPSVLQQATDVIQ
jgi:putative ABC transport system substrate-binding protein